VPDFHTLFGDHEKALDETSAMEETTLRIKEVNVRRFWTQELVAIHFVVASLQAGTTLMTFQQLPCGVAFLPVSVRLYIFQMQTYMYHHEPAFLLAVRDHSNNISQCDKGVVEQGVPLLE